MALEPLFPAEVPVTYRRYLLLKEFAARAMGYEALALTWKGIRLELAPGDALPTTFPFRAILIAAGYNELDLLNGATEDEIARNVGLAPFDAKAVVRAYAGVINA